MSQQVFTPDATVGGWIDFNNLVYNVYCPANCLMYGYNGLVGYYISRGYLSFDTSSIPAEAVITSATLGVEFTLAPGGAGLPASWVHTLYIGKDVIGVALNSGDWGAAGFKSNGDYTPANGHIDIPISSGKLGEISTTGKTDFEIRDKSNAYGIGGWMSWFYSTGVSRGARLTVTWEMPKLYNCELKNCKIVDA